MRLWREHWLARLEATLIERLQDDPRPGAPLTFTAEQFCQLIALACQPPELSKPPISHWTPRELADEAIKPQIVESISPRHVGRVLKSGRIKMEMRATFLSDPIHKIVFHFTPKHASWMNQVEVWFSILVRKLIERGNFTSQQDLKEQLIRFIDKQWPNRSSGLTSH